MTSDLRMLEPHEFPRWDQFVSACPQGTIFHTTWWYQAWQIKPVVRVLYDEEGHIEAGVCYATGRRFGALGIVRPPMTPLNGPIFQPLVEGGRNKRHTQAKRMLQSTIGGLPKLGLYDFLLGSCCEDIMPFLWNGFDVLVQHTYLIPRCEQHTWMRETSQKFRYKLGRAKREAEVNHYVIQEDAPIEDVMGLIEQTRAFKEFAMPRVHERAGAWWESVCSRKAGRTFVIRDQDGTALTGAILVYDGRCAYSIASGLQLEARKTSRVRVLLVQRMIEHAHNMGLDYDFEGSVLPGVEHFARSFGGELRPVYRAVKFPALLPYLIWQGHRYWTKHRKRQWVWYE